MQGSGFRVQGSGFRVQGADERGGKCLKGFKDFRADHGSSLDQNLAYLFQVDWRICSNGCFNLTRSCVLRAEPRARLSPCGQNTRILKTLLEKTSCNVKFRESKTSKTGENQHAVGKTCSEENENAPAKREVPRIPETKHTCGSV